MAFFKGTMEFAQGEFGWTESFFTDAPSPGDALDRLQRLGGLRCECLGNRAELMRCEVSQYGVYGSRTVGGAKGVGFVTDAGMPTDPLLVRLESEVTGNNFDLLRDYPLRGLPQTFYVSGQGNSTTYNPGMMGRVKTYLRALTNGDWFLKGSDKTLHQFPINGIAFLSDEEATFYGAPLQPDNQRPNSTWAIIATDANADIPTVDADTGEDIQVLIRHVAWSDTKALRASGLNGTHRAVVLYPGVILIRCNQPVRGEYKGGGRIVKRADTFVRLTGWTLEGQTNWKTGRRKRRAPAHPSSGNYLTPTFVPQRVPDPPGENEIGFDAKDFIPGNLRTTGTIIHNARELVAEVYEGYKQQPDGNYYPIRIRKVAQNDKYYLVTISGTNIASTNADGWLQDVATAFQIRNSYMANVVLTVLQNCPKGSVILLAGDSLGGMVAQAVAPYLKLFGYSVISVQTFGSPIIRFFLGGTSVSRYTTVADLVPTLSPVSFALGPVRPLIYRIVPNPGNPLDPIYNHTHYADVAALEIWDPIGRAIPLLPNGQADANMEVGPVQMFLNPYQAGIFSDFEFSDFLRNKLKELGIE